MIEAYRTLRDRGPYPADQVLKDMDGSFGFVLFDSKAGTVFAALVSCSPSVTNSSIRHCEIGQRLRLSLSCVHLLTIL